MFFSNVSYTHTLTHICIQLSSCRLADLCTQFMNMCKEKQEHGLFKKGSGEYLGMRFQGHTGCYVHDTDKEHRFPGLVQGYVTWVRMGPDKIPACMSERNGAN